MQYPHHCLAPKTSHRSEKRKPAQGGIGITYSSSEGKWTGPLHGIAIIEREHSDLENNVEDNTWFEQEYEKDTVDHVLPGCRMVFSVKTPEDNAKEVAVKKAEKLAAKRRRRKARQPPRNAKEQREGRPYLDSSRALQRTNRPQLCSPIFLVLLSVQWSSCLHTRCW